MDFNALVEEIAARVAKQLEQEESCAEAAKADCPKLMILTRYHGTCCHNMLESERLNGEFDMVCALQNEYKCNVNDYEGIILYNLDVEALSKISAGICDVPYTTMAVQAILMGKKVYAVCDDIELFSYKDSAPKVFYNMMLDKLNLLEKSGVVFCKAKELEDKILGHTAPVCHVKAEASADEGRECCLDKKVITERDVSSAIDSGIKTIKVNAKSIITDLARDYASSRGVKIVKA